MVKKKLAFGLVVISCVSFFTFTNSSEAFARSTDKVQTKISGTEKDVLVSRLAIRKEGIVTAQNGLNVRGGPGTDYGKTGFVYYNETVVVEDSISGWYRISYSTSSGTKYGYVLSQYIRLTGGTDM
ncbi:SH3 domain-containing protein [Clostridium algidicarnis]|uniref:SH3 domain-containing protein n=1 Tax=Clostridium algidicarnis TaxID=37659 RepID=UPI001C0E0076|nr:SH3 domain-containing protein [Clostridium algidicarnis]MBU3204555.1 SH3 domain-containing protein [Clostridium algidicarnis]MBU3212361.1 SH3 domain-containing protein [Clostridium algidicarnis]MBU3222793.1 SH3 domain-containing protein [Clostridium algidicarnis]